MARRLITGTSGTSQVIWDDGEFVLSRIKRCGSGAPALELASSVVPPTRASLEKLDHAYQLRTELDPAWAARPLHFDSREGRLTIEDPGAALLASHVGTPWELGQFLRVAIGLAAALQKLHRRGLIHRDVKPFNIFADRSTGQVCLSGFGLASRLPRERSPGDPPTVIAGTLAYMAPEQTGRMNRSVDSRSDLYACGITLYEMLTGSLPFTASEPMEWIHCHIARQPPRADDRVSTIPTVVADVVAKLLSKGAEERYQTAAGLEVDLRKCLDDWNVRGDIAPFPLGAGDLSDRLLIPERLYGREEDIQTLLAALDRVVAKGAPELVLVSGYSGIGKSSVVHELHKALVPPRGLFASGKFDQYRRNIPYATLAQAFQRLVRFIIGQNEPELAQWRDALRDALGANGQVMIDLVPELELIIGLQVPAPDLPPRDAQHRFQTVFRRFVGVFARPEHPLTLFLDDLQWLDAATLDLLEHLMTQSDVRHLLVVGAYRNNEVGPSHPLTQRLNAIRRTPAAVHEIVLGPLKFDDVVRLVADALHCTPTDGRPLATLVQEKTAGNPFFVIQFLAELAAQELISFDTSAGWTWALERIQAKGYTDNVAHLMIGKLRRLRSFTQDALTNLACLGGSASPARLGMVLELSEEQVDARLWDAIHEGLILRSDRGYTFLHDRVQEAAYALIAEDARAELHLRIGRRLVLGIPAAECDESIFEIVNQLNRGAALITSREEREQVAEFNLIAGKRAKAAAAYASALNYFAAGTSLLAEDRWDRRYSLAFALELHRAESEFLTGNLVAAEERLSLLSGRTANLIDSASVACLRVNLFTTLDRSDRAVDVGLEYLRRTGEQWPPHPTKEAVRQEYDRICQRIESRSIEDLVDLPYMDDPTARATLDVLTAVLPPAMFTDENLFSLAICRMVNLSLEHGNSDASCYAYVVLGMIVGPHFGDYKSGFRFGKLGVDLVEKSGLNRFKARVCLSFGSVVAPWTTPMKSCRALVRRAFDAAQESGDLTHAAYSRHILNSNLLASGEPLAEVQHEAEHGLRFARASRFGLVVDTIATQLALIRTLRGLTSELGSFNDAQFNETEFEQHLIADPGLAFAACWYWIRKLEARFYAGDHASALAAASSAQPLLWSCSAFIEVAEYHFYSALAHAAHVGLVPHEERSRHLDALVVHQRQLATWADNCRDNFGDRAALVDAEIARLEGRDLEAERLYETTIRLAREHGFIHNEALANELAAKFCAAQGFEVIAGTYLQNARYCYQRWGADAKVRQLERLHPFLQQPEALSKGSAIAAPVEHLDLATVVKVSQAVSTEIVLETLIDKLMVIALEHAAAERGLLVLPDEREEMFIAAEATSTAERIAVQRVKRSATAAMLPETILNYVVRARDAVVVDDAAAASLYSDDAYITRSGVRSILCLPLVKQTKLTGVLYLENTVAANVFTPERIAILKLVASQAAVSIENARLYTDLQRTQAYLAHAQELSQTGSFGWNVSTGEIIWSPETFRIYDFDPSTPLTLEAIVARTHPDDRTSVLQMIDRLPLEDRSFSLEYRLLMSDGSIKFLHSIGRRTALESSVDVAFAGAVTDVTAAKVSQRSLERAIREIERLKDQLQEENVALREEIDKTSMFEEIVGASPALRAVLSHVSKVAPTDSSVLITGETGTGKELVARAIHKRSARASRPFVGVNCAAVPASLIASELFGHERGAFTGATEKRVGRFELADGGTLFLDEVGDLPTDTQVALLRVLQEREFERVGGTRPIRVNVRVIAATNRDLESAIAEKTFRADLFYRLNVFPLEVPSLRDRQEDIPLLVEYFVDRFAKRAGKPIRGIGRKALDLLKAYAWPGNIRELQNVIERAVIISDTGTLTVDARWLSSSRLRSPSPTQTLVAHERQAIEAALAESQGRVSGPFGAALKLGVPASTLETKIKALQIDKRRFKAGANPTSR